MLHILHTNTFHKYLCFVFVMCLLRAPATEIDVTVRGGRARSVGRSDSYIISLFVYHKIRDSLKKIAALREAKNAANYIGFTTKY